MRRVNGKIRLRKPMTRRILPGFLWADKRPRPQVCPCSPVDQAIRLAPYSVTVLTLQMR